MLYSAVILAGFFIVAMGAIGLHRDYKMRLQEVGAREELFLIKEKLTLESARADKEKADRVLALTAEKEALEHLDICMQTVSTIRSDAEKRVAEASDRAGAVSRQLAVTEKMYTTRSKAAIASMQNREDILQKKLNVCASQLAEKEKVTGTKSADMDSLLEPSPETH